MCQEERRKGEDVFSFSANRMTPRIYVIGNIFFTLLTIFLGINKKQYLSQKFVRNFEEIALFTFNRIKENLLDE